MTFMHRLKTLRRRRRQTLRADKSGGPTRPAAQASTAARVVHIQTKPVQPKRAERAKTNPEKAVARVESASASTDELKGDRILTLSCLDNSTCCDEIALPVVMIESTSDYADSSMSSSRSFGSDLTCATEIEPVDDGLTMWGLPKVLCCVDDQDTPDGEVFYDAAEHSFGETLVGSASTPRKLSVAQVARTPPASYLRIKQLLAVVYLGWLLQHHRRRSSSAQLSSEVGWLPVWLCP